MNVSPTFALPLKVIKPFFIFSASAYLASIVLLGFLTPNIESSDFKVIGIIHLYMLGFVMMSIIGAIGQLSVVVAEVNHRYPIVFTWIFPIFATGIITLVSGFYYSHFLILIGGLIVCIALGVFAFNLFLTIHSSTRRTAITYSMQWSTFFLGLGIIFGILMAFAYAGIISINPSKLLFTHVILIFGGYVLLNIMGASTVLLPMFGACNRPSDNDHTASFYTMITASFLSILNVFISHSWIQPITLILVFVSIFYYLALIYRIFTSRKRTYSNIWERSVAIAFLSLLLSLSIGFYGVIAINTQMQIIAFWIFLNGFLGFLIFAHLYKIIPFLVWFERFAPLIEKHSVPTLQQMLPDKWANIQWGFGVFGLITVSIALLNQNMFLWYSGIISLIISSVILLGIIISIIRYKELN